MLKVLALMLSVIPVRAEEVGCVSTTFRMLGAANDKICVESFRDEKVDGVVCHISRAVTGGLKGVVGLAEDTSDASIACRQVGQPRCSLSGPFIHSGSSGARSTASSIAFRSVPAGRPAVSGYVGSSFSSSSAWSSPTMRSARR